MNPEQDISERWWNYAIAHLDPRTPDFARLRAAAFGIVMTAKDVERVRGLLAGLDNTKPDVKFMREWWNRVYPV